jgi:aconitate hydratase
MAQSLHESCKTTAKTQSGQEITVFSLKKLAKATGKKINKLPYSIRILVENQLRNIDGKKVTEADVIKVLDWDPKAGKRPEIPYMPARVVMQDFTGVPAVVDLAAMRNAMKVMGGDPNRINPLVETALVIDHSVQVDYYGTPDALNRNVDIEFQRNKERYSLLKWAQKAFDNFKVVPPGMGIIHQVNLEYLARVALTKEVDGQTIAYPDTLVGTDSHTTMINGLGVMGWGVGGIEAEAVMLGQPIYMLLPDVVGLKLTGKLREGVTATDLVLRVTQLLREHGVVGKFVEYFGDGLANLSLPDRATLANMAPEYGATMGFFPVDDVTCQYLVQSNRGECVDVVKTAMQELMLYRKDKDATPEYTAVLELDLDSVDSTLAGPKRPQDRIPMRKLKAEFKKSLSAEAGLQGFGLEEKQVNRSVPVKGMESEITHGSVVIAAITSCTNTSNPYVMLGAGLLAQKAVEKGLTVKPFVKTSLAPGSQVVTEYLKAAGLLKYLEALKFNVVGYGCTTCIGNSGPLDQPVIDAIEEGDLVAASVLSGNRNFEGRVNPYVKANFLASPMHVVAYAIAGTVSFDPQKDAVGTDKDGKKVLLKDIWPSNEEIHELASQVVTPQMYAERYKTIFDGTDAWKSLPAPKGSLYGWDDKSTYIRCPSFFENLRPGMNSQDIIDARVLALLGDSVTTDHISPAGAIPADYPAGRYLQEHGVEVKDFNSYGSRRGNHEVMMRGTFGNVRIRNKLVPGMEGSFTKFHPTGEVEYIYDAAMQYQQMGTPLVVIGGTEYGTGSSRDWAAKGTYLLGVRAVIAQSYERIHRSNLVGMGVLPLQFKAGESAQSLGLNGSEVYTIRGLKDLQPGQMITVNCRDDEGNLKSFDVLVRIDTDIEVEYYQNSGILQSVLLDMVDRK